MATRKTTRAVPAMQNQNPFPAVAVPQPNNKPVLYLVLEVDEQDFKNEYGGYDVEDSLEGAAKNYIKNYVGTGLDCVKAALHIPPRDQTVIEII